MQSSAKKKENLTINTLEGHGDTRKPPSEVPENKTLFYQSNAGVPGH